MIQVSVVNTTRLIDFVSTTEPLTVAMPAGWPSKEVLEDLVRAAPSPVEDEVETMTAMLTLRDNAAEDRVPSPTKAAKAIREHAQQACGVQAG